jgi:hypothetical protein
MGECRILPSLKNKEAKIALRIVEYFICSLLMLLPQLIVLLVGGCISPLICMIFDIILCESLSFLSLAWPPPGQSSEISGVTSSI